MNVRIEKQTAQEFVLAYNKLSTAHWPAAMAFVDMVILTTIATLKDPEVRAVLEKLRSKEEKNGPRALALLVAVNSSPYGEGFEAYVRNAIKVAQKICPISEKVATLFRAELAFVAGWEQMAPVVNYESS